MNADLAKRAAAEKALTYPRDGMVLGLGTGSTVEAGFEKLAQLIAAGLRVTCVSSSVRTTQRARQLGIPLVELDQVRTIDLSIDGADQVDPHYAMIKGGGGALLREKIMASHARRRIFIVDRSKLVPILGHIDLPVEVVPYGWTHTAAVVAKRLGAAVRVRRDGDAVVTTDNGNHLLDCPIGDLPDPQSLDRDLRNIPGVVATGIFVDMVDTLIIGDGLNVDVQQVR
ncbi:MAG TPA: ribose-5-phosphate isomerase RpiA [Dongiaceae bacterium]